MTRVMSLIQPLNLQSRRVAEKTGLAIEAETEYKGLHHYIYSVGIDPKTGRMFAPCRP
jgi:hypothetical protein